MSTALPNATAMLATQDAMLREMNKTQHDLWMRRMSDAIRIGVDPHKYAGPMPEPITQLPPGARVAQSVEVTPNAGALRVCELESELAELEDVIERHRILYDQLQKALQLLARASGKANIIAMALTGQTDPSRINPQGNYPNANTLDRWCIQGKFIQEFLLDLDKVYKMFNPVRPLHRKTHHEPRNPPRSQRPDPRHDLRRGHHAVPVRAGPDGRGNQDRRALSPENIQALREYLWLRMHENQRWWDEDAALWRRVWFSHWTVMVYWMSITYLHQWGLS